MWTFTDSLFIITIYRYVCFGSRRSWIFHSCHYCCSSSVTVDVCWLRRMGAVQRGVCMDETSASACQNDLIACCCICIYKTYTICDTWSPQNSSIWLIPNKILYFVAIVLLRHLEKAKWTPEDGWRETSFWFIFFCCVKFTVLSTCNFIKNKQHVNFF